MTVINKSVFCRNLDGARLLGHPVYTSSCIKLTTNSSNEEEEERRNEIGEDKRQPVMSRLAAW